jgi:hypothetical protein
MYRKPVITLPRYIYTFCMVPCLSQVAIVSQDRNFFWIFRGQVSGLIDNLVAIVGLLPTSCIASLYLLIGTSMQSVVQVFLPPRVVKVAGTTHFCEPKAEGRVL